MNYIMLKTTLKAVIKKNWKIYSRNFPIVFFINRILIKFYAILSGWLMSTILFNGELSTMFYQSTPMTNYMTFLVTGIAFHNLSIGLIMNVSRALMTEHRNGTLLNMLISPFSRVGYFFGVFIEQFFRLMLELVIILIIGGLFGANIFSIPFYYWVIGIGITIIFIFPLALILNNIILFLGDAFLPQNTLFYLMMFLCGVNFPIEYFPKNIQYICYCLPLTQVLKIFRILASGNDMQQLMHLITSGFIVSIIFLIIGIVSYKKIETKIAEYL